MRLGKATMTHNAPPRYPECHRCPFYQSEECLIASSRILLYFYCFVSEGFRPLEGLPDSLDVAVPMAASEVAMECSR